MAARGRDLPDGIKGLMDEARERAKRLGDSLRGWRSELLRWHDLSIDVELGLSRVDFKIENVSTINSEKRVIRSAPIAQLVGPDATNLVLPTYVLPAIVLTLDAPDVEIRAAFEAKLSEARECYPPPLKKPGRLSGDRQRSWHDIFRNWRDHDILPLAEFIAWRSTLSEHEREKYPMATFARWRDRDKGTTAQAEKVLNKAISNLPMLNRAPWGAEDDLGEEALQLVKDWTPHFEAVAKTANYDS